MAENEYRDLAGQDIKVGDYVIYSTSEGRAAVMKLGQVTELTRRKTPRHEWGNWNFAIFDPTVKVVSIDPWREGSTWEWSRALQNGGRPVTLGEFGRILVVTTLPALVDK